MSQELHFIKAVKVSVNQILGHKVSDLHPRDLAKKLCPSLIIF